MPSSLAELRAACAEPILHPDDAALRATGQAVLDLAIADFTRLAELDPAATASRADMERLLREPPPEKGTELLSVLADFQSRVLPHNMRPNHPRFLAFVPSAPSFESILGDWLCAATNVFGGVWLEAAAAAQIELVVLDWFKEVMGYPAEAGGLLTSGGSEANLTALVVARERLTVAERRLAILYVSDQRHWSIDRAARVIGLQPEQVCVIPSGADFRLEPERLGEQLATDRRAGRVPWLVVANAGATNTGVCDPLDALAGLCQSAKLWLHVDAAYGWPAVLTERRRDLRGIEEADSVTLDPHKWLAQTYEAGCLLVRGAGLLERAFALAPEYLQDVTAGADEVSFADRGIALTRRFRALKIWLALKVLGVDWHRRLVDHGCRLGEYAQAMLEQQGCFEVLSPCRLSTLCFRHVGAHGQDLNALNRRLCAEANRSGRMFLATTQLRGATALRLCFVNWRTTAADVDEVVALLRSVGDRLV